jgi:threonine synthase
MGGIIHLICVETGERYPASEPRWRSESGLLLDLEFSPDFDPARTAGRKPTLWRYREALPIDLDENIVTFDEGFTPLLPVTFGGRTVLVKQEQLFPTGSYKDRGASVLISKVSELGVRRVVQDSSGNAGCSVAAYCARAGISCEIFVPEETSAGKLVQIAQTGARLHRIPGSREDTARAAMEAARTTYYASHCWNPFFLHGTKTFAYEVCEQLGWRAPDTVILPAGNGTLVLGASIGFGELCAAGIIPRTPRIVAVQAAVCAPLFHSWKSGDSMSAAIRKGHTMAEGIAIAEPVRGPQVIRAIVSSGGGLMTVEEEEIASALTLVSRQGFSIEPTSAAVIAGLLKYLPGSSAEEVIVSAFTGHGLKSTETMMALLERRERHE